MIFTYKVFYTNINHASMRCEGYKLVRARNEKEAAERFKKKFPKLKAIGVS